MVGRHNLNPITLYFCLGWLLVLLTCEVVLYWKHDYYTMLLGIQNLFDGASSWLMDFMTNGFVHV